MVKRLFILTTLLSIGWELRAQLLPPCPSNDYPASDLCSDICIYCNFNNYMGSTSGYSGQTPPGFCGIIENEQWLGFIAGTGGATFTATPNNCNDGNGVQIALYTDCNSGPVPSGCNGGCSGCGMTPVSINVALTPGANYFLLIDGYAGDQCDFTITVIPPSAVQAPNVGNTGLLSGPITACPGETLTFSVPPVSGAGGYIWNAPADWLINGQSPPVTTTAPGGNLVTVIMGHQNGQICVQPFNSCNEGNTVCKAVTAQPLNLVQAAVQVILQGPYVSSVQLMHDSLRTQNLIPLTEPYTGLTNFTHIGGGGEQTTSAVLAVTGSDAIVDWVFLELRDATDPAQVLATRAALLQRDGDVVDVDGVSAVGFNISPEQDFFLAVRHRNHLGVQLGLSKYYPGCDAVETDFRSLPPEGFYGYNGLNAAQKVVGSQYLLWAANGKVDYQLKYNGSNNDRNAILSVVGLATPNAIVPGYLLADYNLDGVVKYNGSANDRNVLLGNVGAGTPSAILYDQIAR